MAVLNDLIAQIENPELRARIEAEVSRLNKQKKFGLVFEEHLPECTPLYDIPVKAGGLVAPKSGQVNEVYRVLQIEEERATCAKKDGSETVEFMVDDLVSVAEFGEPIYPYLKPLDSVCNAPDSDLWHTLIEADNYHALQLLEYLYAGKVDCIYIDPPYNTGAKDWKYNNDYVDGADAYRHSKWLSFMEKRLKLAKKLLNPCESVLIVTIDEKEYLHLGCLLEEMFADARIQMITSIIKPEGTQRRNEFSRTNEFVFFVMIGNKYVDPYINDMVSDDLLDSDEEEPLVYKNFRRTDSNSVRAARPNQFYPIFVDKETGKIMGVGDVMKPDESRFNIQVPDGQVAIVPLRDSGQEMLWRRTPDAFRETLKEGFAYAQRTSDGFYIKYLSSQLIEKIKAGEIVITDRKPDGELIGHYKNEKLTMPKTVWTLKTHNARDYGSLMIKKLFGGEIRFTFPKSLYAVLDSLRLMIGNKPDALVVDFFAGSGTTLHAVNLLNAEDGGHRRCIMITNNEVSAEESKELTERGVHPGDEEWDEIGIARYVTWPRTVSSIIGKDVKGNILSGNYYGNNRPLAEGFCSNAAFFKLGFLDKTAVALGRQFKELLPVLWMKAGAIGECPTIDESNPSMLVLPKNKFAVLADEKAFMEFITEIDRHPEINTVYIVTDSERAYRDMISFMEGKQTYQLYRDYLDNFRINSVRR